MSMVFYYRIIDNFAFNENLIFFIIIGNSNDWVRIMNLMVNSDDISSIFLFEFLNFGVLLLLGNLSVIDLKISLLFDKLIT